jgi:hypothetical protein
MARTRPHPKKVESKRASAGASGLRLAPAVGKLQRLCACGSERLGGRTRAEPHVYDLASPGILASSSARSSELSEPTDSNEMTWVDDQNGAAASLASGR